MKGLIKTSFLIILCFTACKQDKSSTVNDETDTTKAKGYMEKNKKQQFVGSWELQEWMIESKDGKQDFPFGVDAIGQINYDINGNMSVMVMKNNRPQFLSEDPLQGEPNEVVTAFKGFIAYSGNYEVNLNSKQVTHQIKISSFPNWVGQNQIRNFELKEDKLILSTDFIGPNKHKLVWRKIDF
ncbi:lipocalin-like domain-containing protein [Echinicola shivajiensis]|uniref:lipocalin-like domain-containing protein n=1 Tax=Echinicola shivajiensis TaxID=1035916 RepID=UPI001BFC083C|nr:lipocalin-like domain-containing protein [Echinicola shivajiensis]